MKLADADICLNHGKIKIRLNFGQNSKVRFVQNYSHEFQWWNPREHILKSLALASKPVVPIYVEY